MTRDDIEKAIEWIDQEKTRTEDYLNDPDMPMRQGANVDRVIAFSENKIKQLDVIIAALSNSQRKMDECWVCIDGGKYLYADFCRQIRVDDFETHKIRPSYCPECGRKLESNMEVQDE